MEEIHVTFLYAGEATSLDRPFLLGETVEDPFREILDIWLGITAKEMDLDVEDDYDRDPDSWTPTFRIFNEVTGEFWFGYTPYRGEDVQFIAAGLDHEAEED